MHTNNSYEFETEVEAQEYIDTWFGDSPDRDTHVRGPSFIDEAVVLRGCPGVHDRKYWTVTVEKFS